ncbi:hypothetical protein QBC45DRAFT_398501 [Copromyces sp. CBS 386.78]|nr:hypothetical protein QBC45DRAFT_398501 [Copromyces sp. CBS 386.78]
MECEMKCAFEFHFHALFLSRWTVDCGLWTVDKPYHYRLATSRLPLKLGRTYVTTYLATALEVIIAIMALSNLSYSLLLFSLSSTSLTSISPLFSSQPRRILTIFTIFLFIHHRLLFFSVCNPSLPPPPPPFPPSKVHLNPLHPKHSLLFPRQHYSLGPPS